MSDRIRQLEDALAILQASTGAHDPHPLLSRDLLEIKSSVELHSASLAAGVTNANADSSSDNSENEMVFELFGTLAVRDDGGTRFFGSSARQEVFRIFHMSSLVLNSCYRVYCLTQTSNVSTLMS